MATSKERILEFEKEYKESIYGKIGRVIKAQQETISSMEQNIDSISELSIQNTAITTNNKIVELSNIFRKAGLSLFCNHNDKYNYVETSFIGDSLIFDLVDKLNESSTALEDLSNTLGTIFNRFNEKILAYQKMKLFPLLRVRKADFSITDEEQDLLIDSLQRYMEIDSEIWNYNLENDLVPALVTNIVNREGYSYLVVPELLEEVVIPDLNKLGLNHLIPILEESLQKEYNPDENTKSRK